MLIAAERSPGREYATLVCCKLLLGILANASISADFGERQMVPPQVRSICAQVLAKQPLPLFDCGRCGRFTALCKRHTSKHFKSPAPLPSRPFCRPAEVARRLNLRSRRSSQAQLPLVRAVAGNRRAVSSLAPLLFLFLIAHFLPDERCGGRGHEVSFSGVLAANWR